MREAVRTLLRTLPLDDDEPRHAATRRMFAALSALSTLRPRDKIELMLGVQALAAYHAAAALWRLGMNLKHPRGDGTRHFTTAATTARTFDTLLKAIERRQAKPLAPPRATGSRSTPPASSTSVWQLFAQVATARQIRGGPTQAAAPPTL
jgi:hypothetical protein